MEGLERLTSSARGKDTEAFVAPRFSCLLQVCCSQRTASQSFGQLLLKGVGNILALVKSVTVLGRTLSIFCFLKRDVYLCGNMISI